MYRIRLVKNLIDPELYKDDVNSIPQIIHIIWLGGDVPEFVIDNINTWSCILPNWRVKFYNDINITEYVDSDFLELMNNAKTYAGKADMLRYYLLYKYGGYYIDADITPLRPLNILTKLDTKMIICNDTDIYYPYVMNAFLATIEKNEFYKFVLERLKNVNFDLKAPFSTGPVFLGDCLVKFNDWPEDMIIANLLPSAFYKRIGDFDLDTNNIITHDNPDRLGLHAYMNTHEIEDNK